MTTSGTYRHTVDFNDIAEEALDIMQVAADGESLTADQQKRCRKTMNFMLKAWEGHGIHLWTFEEGSLFLAKGQSEYSFSSSNLANTWEETTLSADEALGQAVLSCASTTDITALDVVGVVLDDDTLHWSTVVSKTATEITINDALPSAASLGSHVRTYVPSSFIPANKITQVRRRESSTYETEINFESRKDYFNLPDKVSQGSPVQAYFSRQEDAGIMYIWPAPSTANDVINFTYERPIQVIDSGSDTLDIPNYWYEAIIYNLAERLILKFGCSQGRAQIIREKAISSLDLALEYDTDLYPIVVKING